jgi:hypothetical protein
MKKPSKIIKLILILSFAISAIPCASFARYSNTEGNRIFYEDFSEGTQRWTALNKTITDGAMEGLYGC